MNIVVLGSGGLLGTATVREWRSAGYHVHALTRADIDVTVAREVRDVISALSPQVLVNCTAYNAVDDAESHPVDALRVNAFALRSMARAATDAGVLLVHYSTDFVFDGVTSQPYTELDAPNPQSAYGASKLQGEWFAAQTARHYVLRVESLFGGTATRGTIDWMLEAIRTGQQVRAFADRIVSPSYVADVAHATRQLVECGGPVGLYHCVNSGHTSWLGVAEALRELLGRPDADIVATSAADAPLRASRPMFAALSNGKLGRLGIPMPAWQDALARHVLPTKA